MPRGQSKPFPILASNLGNLEGAGGRSGSTPRRRWGGESNAEETRASIEQSVGDFARAWFLGDSTAMLRCLHPDYVHRLVSIDGRGEPPTELLRSAVGVQGHFGSLTPPERRREEVRILDVRSNSASAIAFLGDWVLQVHLARSGGQWSIVNALWEMD